MIAFKRYDQKRDVCCARNGDKNHAVLLGCGGKTRFNLRPRKYQSLQNKAKTMDRDQFSG